MIELIQKIDLTKKDRDKIKSKYFIVVLSTQRNLNLCRQNSIAGFPETDNGQWAFLDINIGDYISFYFNGRVYDLYEVTEKQVPNRWRNKLAKGNEHLDPETLTNGEKWDSIKTNENFIYFPFRLKLNKIVETHYDSNIVFKSGFERLGINLVPRVSLKKTHFQLSIKDIKKYFNKEVPIKESDFDIKSFILCKKRSQYRTNQNNTFDFENFIIDEITHKEIYLQAFLKKILESQISKINLVEYCENYEFLSEQTTDGGESDIVVLCKSKEELEFYIELKNTLMIKKDKLTKKAQEAIGQVKRYHNILNKELTLRGIGGKNSNQDNSLRIYKCENILIFEIDSNIKLSEF